VASIHSEGLRHPGTDGHLGTVTDLLLDDSNWKMRWLLVSTGDWFPGREVLLPVAVLEFLDPVLHQFRVTLTVQQIQNSPHADGHLPVSRQKDVDPPPQRAAARSPVGSVRSASSPHDPHLRSMEGVIGHHVHAVDGLIGHIDDLLIDDADWSVRFIEVDTRNWGPERRLLLPPRLIRAID
jgi:hypothetical protein